MTRKEFLDGLKAALGNDLRGPVIQENVNYYNGYISDEVGKGRREEEVIAELGDPWVIARTIIDAGEGQSDTRYQEEEYGYGAQRNAYSDTEERRVRVSGHFSWWKRLLFVLGVIGVIMIITAVVGGIVSLLAPVVIPVIVVVFIVRLLRSRR